VSRVGLLLERPKTYAAAETVAQFAPGYVVADKADSRLQRAAGWCLARIGSPAYMESFWSTFPRLRGGAVTYRPAKVLPDAEEACVIFHEGVHAMQVKRAGGPLFAALYMFPQSLGALALLYGLVALVAGLPLWPALLAVGLAPLPAPWRCRWEAEAYEVSAAAAYWARGGMSAGEQEAFTQYVLRNFTTGDYYWMGKLWYGARMRRRLDSWFAQLRVGAATTKTPYLLAVRAAVEAS